MSSALHFDGRPADPWARRIRWGVRIRYRPAFDAALPWHVYPWIGWCPLAAFSTLPAAHTWATTYVHRQRVHRQRASIEAATAYARSLTGKPYVYGGDPETNRFPCQHIPLGDDQ